MIIVAQAKKIRRRKRHHAQYIFLRIRYSRFTSGAIVACLVNGIFAMLLFSAFVLVQLPDVGTGVCGLGHWQNPCTPAFIFEESLFFSAIIFFILLIPSLVTGILVGLIIDILR